MAQSTTSWRNGQSGNPKGRPPMRTRPLATVLREVGSESVSESENRTAVATLIWQALRTGKLELDAGNNNALTAKEWLDLVKWVHLHIDGRLDAKDQTAEARDQQLQLDELFADQDADVESESPDLDPQSASNPPPPEPVLHTLS